MKKKIIIVSIILFLILGIYYFINNYGVTYLFFDYDNVIKIKNNNYKKVKINRLKRLNYSKASLLTKDGIKDGYIGIDDKKYEVTFYDNNMTSNQNGIIKIGDLTLNNKSDLITEKLRESDLGNIIDILDDNDIDQENAYITKAKLSDDQIIYSILEFQENHIISIIFIKDANDNDIDIEVYKRNITDFTKNYSKLTGIITVENNKYPILILSSHTPYTDNGQCNSIYTYNTNLNKYEPKINCE